MMSLEWYEKQPYDSVDWGEWDEEDEMVAPGFVVINGKQYKVTDIERLVTPYPTVYCGQKWKSNEDGRIFIAITGYMQEEYVRSQGTRVFGDVTLVHDRDGNPTRTITRDILARDYTEVK